MKRLEDCRFLRARLPSLFEAVVHGFRGASGTVARSEQIQQIGLLFISQKRMTLLSISPGMLSAQSSPCVSLTEKDRVEIGLHNASPYVHISPRVLLPPSSSAKKTTNK